MVVHHSNCGLASVGGGDEEIREILIQSLGNSEGADEGEISEARRVLDGMRFGSIVR